MRWEQTVGLVGWRRIGPKMSENFVRWCRIGPVVSDWSGGVGLVCGMKRGILETASGDERTKLGAKWFPKDPSFAMNTCAGRDRTKR